MHDPMVVAFTIPRLWPTRAKHHDKPGTIFEWRYKHKCHGPYDYYEGKGCPGCQGQTRNQMFPWWKPGSYSKFMVILDKGLYWPSLITIWHNEPDGHDSFEICKRDSHWKWHIHHWSIQIHPFQSLRRKLLTRCEWCKGRSRKKDHVNVSHSWDREKSPWWKGERGLYHQDCSGVMSAWKTCTCESPVLDHTDYGHCARCNRFRAWGQKPEYMWFSEEIREHIPEGRRDRAQYERLVKILQQKKASTKD